MLTRPLLMEHRGSTAGDGELEVADEGPRAPLSPAAARRAGYSAAAVALEAAPPPPPPPGDGVWALLPLVGGREQFFSMNRVLASCTLSFVGGYVDAALFSVLFELFTANITGNLVCGIPRATAPDAAAPD